MAQRNNTPEQNLINGFVTALRLSKDANISIVARDLINNKCGSKNFADIEYVSDSGIHWVIEAKTAETRNMQNEVHKVFGNLLKETGRNERDKCNYALLIPEESENYFRKGFGRINYKKYINFGKLIPIDTVFFYGRNGITRKTWADLRESQEGSTENEQSKYDAIHHGPLLITHTNSSVGWVALFATQHKHEKNIEMEQQVVRME